MHDVDYITIQLYTTNSGVSYSPLIETHSPVFTALPLTTLVL